MTSKPSENIEIRSHIMNEPAALRRLLYYAIYIPPGEPAPDPGILDRPELSCYFAGWGRPGDRAMFALDADQVVGACWIRQFPLDAPGYGTVDGETPELSISVLPDYRGKGIGTQMLNRLLENVKCDFPAISLSVSKDNSALQLYKRFGFITVKETQHSLVLRKLL
jgi:ribosomal protein S18 acetylase RimI-like enzyme